jgi:LmbE family N-acetylglucosaminyl deacetylase
MKASRRNAMMMSGLVALCTGTSAIARGVTLAHEGFEYSAATADTVTLGGKNGGTGWAGAWSASPTVPGAGTGAYIDAKDMTYPGLASAGMAVKMGRSGWSQPGGDDSGGRAARQLDLARVNPALLSNGQLGAPGTEIWLAFTASAVNWFNGNSGNKIGLSLTSGGAERLSLGANAGSQSPGAWVLTPNLGSTAGETAIASAGSQVRLFVVRIAFTAGDEQVTVWHNPAITASGPSGGAQVVTSFPDFTFNGIALQSNRTDGVPVFDEIRVGTGFASVVSDIPLVADGALAEETFEYAYTAADATPLNGAAGGTGWASPWTSAPGVTGCGAGAYIDTRDMGSPGLRTAGHAVKLGRNGWAQTGCNDEGATAVRSIDRNRVHSSLLKQGGLGADGTTLWLAFTGFASSWLDGNGGNKIGLSLTRGAAEVLSIGANGGLQSVGSWVLTPNLGNATGQTQLLPHDNAVHLFVVKLEFNAGAEKVTVWGDPDIRGSAPTGGTMVVNAAFPDFTFDGVRLQSNRTDAVPVFDNLRIGTSFASVTRQERELLIVAHQDDDLLFMSPDLAGSIRKGDVVRTVYVTDGEGNTPHDMNYVIGRENGVMTAYAQMAGKPNAWSCGDVLTAGKPVRRCSLGERVSLVFLRLPASVGGSVLSSLWSTPGYTVTDWNTGATYSRQDVIQVLTAQMAGFAPTRVSTGESGGVYGYDHPEHNTSALFALEAHHAYPGKHLFARYRGYSVSSEPPNVTASETGVKETTFRWYAACDKYMCSTASCGVGIGCAPTGYSDYYPRQYLNAGLRTGAWRLRNTGVNACLSAGTSLSMASCASVPQQAWTLNDAHQLVSSDGRCLRSSGQNGTAVVLEPCASIPGQRWTPLDNGLVLGTSGLCLAVNGGALLVSTCGLTPAQQWTFGTP